MLSVFPKFWEIVMKIAVVFGVLLIVPAIASGQSYVYPKKGQSTQQTQMDQTECRSWASEQAAANPPATTSPGPVRGAARGALLGGAVGGLTDKDAGDTAAAGAAVGGLGSAMRRRDDRREQAQAAPERGFAACMEARGYSVR